MFIRVAVQQNFSTYQSHAVEWNPGCHCSCLRNLNVAYNVRTASREIKVSVETPILCKVSIATIQNGLVYHSKVIVNWLP